METRSRKRAEAPSSSAVSTRASKRRRFNSILNSSKGVQMDESSGSGRSRRGKNHVLEKVKESEKGKEKEFDVRVRGNEVERMLGLKIESNRNDEEDEESDDDDEDSEDGVGMLHQNLTSASSALQGLLRKLGAGLDDLLPSSAMAAASSSHQSGRLKKILVGLRAEGEEGKQVEALTQLCDLLSIGTEDSLSTFPVDSFVPVLVGLLGYESNPDIMLLAARAITHLCDVLPSSCSAVVHYGAVSSFVNRLVAIQYMDLAEQSLQALKKISQEHPTACLRAGALIAVLSYLDFFSTGVQRVALSSAANICKKLPSDASDFVMDAVPILTNLLQYHDAKVVEHASICLTRITEAFASSSDNLDQLCNHGLVMQAATLISTTSSGGGQASLSTSTYTGLVHLLSTCASGSPLGAKTLLLLGISGILKNILSGSGLVAGMSATPALSRPPEQIFEIVNLANELLPPLPEGTISLPASCNIFDKGSHLKKAAASSSEVQVDSTRNSYGISTREKLLNEQPELLHQFGMDLLPVLIQIYGSSVNGSVRHKCLSVIGKLMYFSSADMIQSLLSGTNISSFLAGVLAWKDPQVLVPALQIADILMEKLPGTFSNIFVREGVVHAVDALILTGSTSTVVSQASLCEMANDSITGSSSRSRLYQRRGDNSSSNVNSSEDSKYTVPTIGSPPNATEIPSVNSNIRMAVSACAKTFKEKYFRTSSGDAGVTDDLLNLKNLCSRLKAGIQDGRTKSKGTSRASGPRIANISDIEEDKLVGVISEMLLELSNGNGVSTFEFIGSGVVDALLNYFSCGYTTKEKLSEANLSKLRQQAIRRYKSFVELALPSGVHEKNDVPMSILVQKLQDALSSSERFPVVLSHSARSSSGNVRLSSGLSALSQPFKLRLCRSQGEKSLRDYSSNVVLIDPLATLAAIEDFLWPRVQRADSVQKSTASVGSFESGKAPTGAGASSLSTATPAYNTRRHSTRSRASIVINENAKKESSQERTTSLSKGKGKAVLKTAQEDGRGPQTRHAARRKAVLDKDAEMKPVEVDSSSEDEDMDISPIEIDEALVIEDDDISEEDGDDHDDLLRGDSLPLCTPDRVHDVKLGDSTDSSPIAPTPSSSQTNPARGSSSTATADKGSDSVNFKSGNSFSSRGAMSFAAAAMAGLASSNGRGIRGARDRQGRLIFGHNEQPKLIFSAAGKQLNRHLTIYQAVQRQLFLDEDDEERYNGNDFVSSDGSRLWGDIYTITYQRADSQTDRASIEAVSSASPGKSSRTGSALNFTVNSSLQQISLLDSILHVELPCDLEKSNPSYGILALLRVLEGLNQLAQRLRIESATTSFAEGKIPSLDEIIVTGVRVPFEEFINSKLTPKLARQIQDALALCSGSLPSWCYQLTRACPFLFPFETRRQYFYSTAFGLSRALHRLQQQQGADGHGSMNEREIRVGRLQRQKVRVSRNRILESAAKVMEMYSSQKAVLEVEYFGEIGTGLGPTLEFYTLLSHDLQKVGLGMWRSNSYNKSASEGDTFHQKDQKRTSDISQASRDLIQAPLGLFPQPWPPSDGSDVGQLNKVIEYFRLLGRVIAKALQDGRLLDLPLSTAFYKLVLGQELNLHDILSFDAELGRSLLELQALVCRKQYLESTRDQDHKVVDIRFRGASVEDLCLDFTLPGYPNYIMKPGDEMVDINNLEEYISLAVDATVRVGIFKQLEAFRAGFNQVFDISALQIFSPDELDYLLCGRRELWKMETLVDHIKFDHGYNAKSPAIVNLLEVMGEFTPEQQRAFCQFVTGAPRLPPGGLAALNPKLTIVRKHSSTVGNMSNVAGVSESADDDLPSVMTCANYLKLPPYSTKEVMCKKLLYAISEGQGSFDLS
ncbi:HECT-type E3 ubiquitin transferase [Heracleum sosnowskyi]|uniref:HECT-type E3 ubiquitin transferase n=1 Tax=Heracleum sosnowskyi TaxID=360622 RepID=A0AAD8HPS1_9APIA|nr:HECT-type E3 ubiquitin transferase [Heracleum sosnowskyi]